MKEDLREVFQQRLVNDWNEKTQRELSEKIERLKTKLVSITNNLILSITAVVKLVHLRFRNSNAKWKMSWELKTRGYEESWIRYLRIPSSSSQVCYWWHSWNVLIVGERNGDKDNDVRDDSKNVCDWEGKASAGLTTYQEKQKAEWLMSVSLMLGETDTTTTENRDHKTWRRTCKESSWRYPAERRKGTSWGQECKASKGLLLIECFDRCIFVEIRKKCEW